MFDCRYAIGCHTQEGGRVLDSVLREHTYLFDLQIWPFPKAGRHTKPCRFIHGCRYAWECQTQEGGWGLDAVLREHSWKLRGIVNGIDTNDWSPARDKFLQVFFCLLEFLLLPFVLFV